MSKETTKKAPYLRPKCWGKTRECTNWHENSIKVEEASSKALKVTAISFLNLNFSGIKQIQVVVIFTTQLISTGQCDTLWPWPEAGRRKTLLFGTYTDVKDIGQDLENQGKKGGQGQQFVRTELCNFYNTQKYTHLSEQPVFTLTLSLIDFTNSFIH